LFAPVLPRNAAAIWQGRRCQKGQVVTLDPGQEADHVTAADYEFVGLTVDGDFFRECAAVFGGFDPQERLVGRLTITPSPACCRALTAHLRELLERVEARPDLFVQPQARQAVEQECVRRVVEMIAQSSGGDRTECWSSNRERLVRGPCRGPCATMPGTCGSAAYVRLWRPASLPVTSMVPRVFALGPLVRLG
jgi:hypothetical protein